MKIVSPPQKDPVACFTFPVILYPESQKAKYWYYPAVILLAPLILLFSVKVLPGRSHDPTFFFSQYPLSGYVAIAFLIGFIFLPHLVPALFTQGRIVIGISSIEFDFGSRSISRMNVPKEEIKRCSIEYSNNKYSRATFRSKSVVTLSDDRTITFDILKTSIRNRQGKRMDAIIERAFEIRTEQEFTVS